MKKDILYTPVVLAFTPNYFIPASTTILSLLLHSKPTDRFEIICLLTENLPPEMEQALEEWNSERLRFTFINLAGQLEGVYIDERYTVAASFRMLLPDILKDYESVIYLDCDIIVRNNIVDLYRNTIDELSDYYVAAVFEATLDFQIPYLLEVGCQPGEYINSGVMIMNLEKMRQENVVPKLIQLSNNPNAEFPDQDAINVVCKGYILGLSPIYNSIRTYFLPQYKADFLRYYSLDDWNDVQRKGTIHYTGSKPWNGYTIEFSTWWMYYDKLPKQIKNLGVVNWKVLVASKILRIPIVHFVFNKIQNLYKRIKYKNIKS